MNLIGDVKDKVAVLVDDMIDTAGTITNAAKVGTLQGLPLWCFVESASLPGGRSFQSMVIRIVVFDSFLGVVTANTHLETWMSATGQKVPRGCTGLQSSNNSPDHCSRRL